MKGRKSIFEKVITEKAEREKTKADELKRIQAEKEKALDEYNSACDLYDKAKNKLDASEMIKTDSAKRQAEDVVKVLDDAISTRKEKGIFSNSESKEYIRSLQKEAEEINTAAAKEIAALLSKIEKIADSNRKVLTDYNNLINDLSGSDTFNAVIMQHQIIRNVQGEINHDRCCFKELFNDSNN